MLPMQALEFVEFDDASEENPEAADDLSGRFGSARPRLGSEIIDPAQVPGCRLCSLDMNGVDAEAGTVTVSHQMAMAAQRSCMLLLRQGYALPCETLYQGDRATHAAPGPDAISEHRETLCNSVYAWLDQNGPTTFREIQIALRMTTPSLSEMLKTLLARGRVFMRSEHMSRRAFYATREISKRDISNVDYNSRSEYHDEVVKYLEQHGPSTLADLTKNMQWSPSRVSKAAEYSGGNTTQIHNYLHRQRRIYSIEALNEDDLDRICNTYDLKIREGARERFLAKYHART